MIFLVLAILSTGTGRRYNFADRRNTAVHGRPITGTNLDPWSLLLAALYMLDRSMMPGSLLRSSFEFGSTTIIDSSIVL